MNLEEGLRQAILANAGIAALVGSRVSFEFAPVSTPLTAPWIVGTRINGAEEGAMDGDQQLSHPTYQFTIGGPNKAQVDRVRWLLCKFNCTEFIYTEDGTPYTLTFHHSNDFSEWEPDSRVSKALVDLIVWVNA